MQTDSGSTNKKVFGHGKDMSSRVGMRKVRRTLGLSETQHYKTLIDSTSSVPWLGRMKRFFANSDDTPTIQQILVALYNVRNNVSKRSALEAKLQRAARSRRMTQRQPKTTQIIPTIDAVQSDETSRERRYRERNERILRGYAEQTVLQGGHLDPNSMMNGTLFAAANLKV